MCAHDSASVEKFKELRIFGTRDIAVSGIIEAEYWFTGGPWLVTTGRATCKMENESPEYASMKPPLENQSRNTLARWLLPAVAMSVGWGFRGDYGHEAGAMVPGALVALAICLTSGREDWWNRAPMLAMLGAIGWAFGGQMSYGKIIGYTAHTSFPDVLYG